jgi:hypothetical protein
MMRRVILLGLIAVSMSLIAGRAIARDQDAPLTGTWDCQSKGGPDGDLTFTLYLQQDGENVDGSVSSPLGDAPISFGSFKQGVLEIEIDTPEGNYILKAKLGDRTLTGTFTYNNEKGTWEGKKQWPAAK